MYPVGILAMSTLQIKCVNMQITPLMFGLSYSSMLILRPPAPVPAPPDPIEAWLDDLCRSTPGAAREVSQPSPLANSSSELAN